MVDIRHLVRSAPHAARCLSVRHFSVPVSLCLLLCNNGIVQTSALTPPVEVESVSPTDPEVILGDRLFFETRFAQFYYEHSAQNVNAALAHGDRVTDHLQAATRPPISGVFRGMSINCRQCHLGDDLLSWDQFAGRNYSDFTRRSPIPDRHDGIQQTVRNSPMMVDLGLPRDVPSLFHFDGEFASLEDLVIDTLTGRNFGWLPSERRIARAHIARVIREDEGVNHRYIADSARQGIPYRVVMLGTSDRLPPHLRIPTRYRIDVGTASDSQILEAAAALITVYVESLRFGTLNTGRTTESPYDIFLTKNNLPKAPADHESAERYAQRLGALIAQKEFISWVAANDGTFSLHNQRYEFGPTELQGLRIFLTTSEQSRSHAGNCVACHVPPRFTDYRFHNTGVSQVEYDQVFGEGSFLRITIPGLATRNSHVDAYLPPSSEYGRATGRFRSMPSKEMPGYADLGVWNVFANPDLPRPQKALRQIFCSQFKQLVNCVDRDILPLTIAHFKTPSIRDLGQSEPYLHSGTELTIEGVLRFYINTSEMMRRGTLRNGSEELAGVRISEIDIPPLAAFLRSLNEDYR
jgi:hypothetical protein